MRCRTSAGMLRAKVVACGMCATIAVGGGAATAMAAASLPDGRAYELVSPAVNKNGADIRPDTQRTRAADDGDAVAFSSLGAFGDAVGTGVAVDYMSERSTASQPGNNGWSTHAITPEQAPMGVNAVLNSDPLYVGDFSSDLDQGVFRSWSPLTADPNVAHTSNLYVRDNLRTSGPGTYRLASPCPLCDATSTPLPALTDSSGVPGYAGASSDFEHVVFESQMSLTSEPEVANGFGPRTYAWNDGQLSYVGYVPQAPDTSCGGTGPRCVPAFWSLPGRGVGTIGGASRPVNVMSTDGSRIFFTAPDGFFGRVGRIYMRTANTTSDELTASERTDCAGPDPAHPDPTCGGDNRPDPAPDAYQGAAYWGASVDGSRIFFSSSQALTDDAPINGDGKLYLYDATKPASDPHNLTLINPDNELGGGDDIVDSLQGVVAASANGRYVYFVAVGQMVAGAPLLRGDSGLYVWHDGAVAFIGRISVDGMTELMTTAGNFQISPPQARVTPDGRFLLFSVHDGSGFSLRLDHGPCQTSYGSGCREMYLYDADTATLTCASCKADRTPPTTEAASGLRVSSAANTTWHLNHAISDDGTRVFFTTGEPLLTQDANGKDDVYQYDVPTGQLHLITSGIEPSDSYFMDASTDGRDVFFVTRERLVGWDTDSSYDIYDARVGGGFPDPVPAPPRCSGASCQGPPAAAPIVPQGGSDSFAGNGDLPGALKPHAKPVRSVRCKRGLVKRRVRGKLRCVRRKHNAAKRHGKRQHGRAK